MHTGGLVLLKDNDIRVTLIDELNRINAQHDYRIIEELMEKRELMWRLQMEDYVDMR